jgi:hypothetical protein
MAELADLTLPAGMGVSPDGNTLYRTRHRKKLAANFYSFRKTLLPYGGCSACCN